MKREKRKEGSCPPGDVTDETKRYNIPGKHNTTKSGRKAQENRKKTKAPSRQPQPFVVRVAQVGSTYAVGLVLCYPVCRLLYQTLYLPMKEKQHNK